MSKALFLPGLIFGLTILTGPAYAQSNSTATSGASNDCSDTEIRYDDDPSLTASEKIELMERALFKSLSDYDACEIELSSQQSNNDVSSQENAAQAGGDQQSIEESVASSDMAGTEEIITPVSASPIGGSLSLESDNGDTSVIQDVNLGEGNGKVPDDIPPADNDSVLAAQIRRAAEQETDPVIKAKLWNEYRRYKGLPIIN